MSGRWYRWTEGSLVLTAALLVLMGASPDGWSQEPGWDPHRYAELVQRANYLSGLADSVPEDAVAERHGLLTDTARVMQDAMAMLRSALVDGELVQFGQAYVDRAQEDLYQGYQKLLTLLVDLDYCQVAEVKLEEALSEPSILPLGAVQWLETMRAPIDRCLASGSGTGLAETPSGQAASTVVGDSTGGTGPGGELTVAEEHRVEPEGPGPVPWILIGAGAALVATGFIYDLTLYNDMDEFDSIQAECDRGACDGDRLLDLQSTLDNGKIIVGSLLGVGLVTAAVGTVLLFTTGDGGEQGVAWIPRIGAGEFGLLWSHPF